ncbi:MAG TPA: PaaI family thioesterase [Symbiobacteriaceae bacterium]
MTDLDAVKDIPFSRHLGVQTLVKEPGHVVLALDLRPEHLNSWEAAHGGIIMSLLDMAMGTSLRATTPEYRGAVTVEMKINFINPGKGRLVAEGRVIHQGRSLSVCEGEVRDGSGQLVAKAMGTFKLLAPKGEGARTEAAGSETK